MKIKIYSLALLLILSYLFVFNQTCLSSQDTISMDFSSGKVKTENVTSFDLGHCQLENRYDDSFHLYYFKGDSFQFNFELTGLVSSADLNVKHLSSASQGKPGITPVTLMVNGKRVTSWMQLSDGYRTDTIPIGRFLKDGLNSVRFDYASNQGTTGYWQKRIDIILSGGNEEDPYSCMDEYAPILSFTRHVRYFPTTFKYKQADNGSGPCCYVNILPSGQNGPYRFQYWFYYEKDIKTTEEFDKVIKGLIDQLCNQNREACESISLDKFIHDHDFECIEVNISRLHQRPDGVVYHGHGEGFSLTRNQFTLKGNHPSIMVLTDMHGSYPNSGNFSPPLHCLKMLVEVDFANILESFKWGNPSDVLNRIIQGKDINERLNILRRERTEFRFDREIDFSSYCRRFPQKMLEIERIEGYNYEPPWSKARNFKY